ncbi:Glutamyl-tRNA(Gln) amidotransferase subunit A, mitochondrial [Neolecta irregularis DAH-3]|uniref:Glutamyl-tRNA(Gln) amidotransferase subunit A, mitochondrial n=1 Tax=Neolecta irregularis (strain DAH-3) TaxID=1198029 RepID=A0A1U7LHN0_NEOID|nr:Glutamyl-tRNA(Gln) amidotransferase subunit A, mitochondrial [Neolecta irregularis DAH-3]|eukprot:OLL22138.1 Glutamyl-tRNA(Gln) amidotransferase subunit A, mitochondrial [Neolecta irregularis DAH-3]
MDEFGMGSNTLNTIYGPTINPRFPGVEHSAGGSSGGSAAVVAANLVDAALGTDTGGSVRLPASYCGCIGFKPSYGMISRWGVVAYANSLDTVGIFASNLANIKKLWEILNHHDPQDPTSLSASSRTKFAHANSDLQDLRRRDKHKIRLGIPKEYNIEELEPEIRTAWHKAREYFCSQGHSVTTVSLPNTKNSLPAYYVLAPAEASSNLAKFDGIRYGHRPEGDFNFIISRDEGFGAEVKRRILLGTYTLTSSARESYYIKAQRVRRLVQTDFNQVFRWKNPLGLTMQNNPDGVDVILAPCSVTTAPTIKSLRRQKSDVESFVHDVFTVPASLAGIPAISIPVQKENQAPIGLQIIAQCGDEEGLLQAASVLENISF